MSLTLLGYMHPEYAASLSEFGTPRHLPRCGGWVLVRPIPGTAYSDAMGCYPQFSCLDWSRLEEDMTELAEDLVSLTIVPGCLDIRDEDRAQLMAGFDHAVEFKHHYVADLTQPFAEFVKKSHRATVRRAQKHVDVSVNADPARNLEKWIELYSTLTERHGIRGIRQFSAQAFERQLSIPGIVAFEAYAEGELVGMDLWYQQGDIAYGHLAAFSDRGYKCRASYATKWAVLEHFSGLVRWVDFGGSPGGSKNEEDGLSQFKLGWSNKKVGSFIYGRIFQPSVYEELSSNTAFQYPGYFPAYRGGEF